MNVEIIHYSIINYTLTTMQNILESETEFIIKEAYARFKNPVILWAGGKDSTTLLHIARKAFSLLEKFPITVAQIDTGYKFRETYKYQDRLVKEWNLPFIRYKIKGAEKYSPRTHSHFECCNYLKTEALKRLILENKFDAVLTGIRWTEHGVRGKESYFSPRQDPPHMRVHPILNWSEKDIWKYLKGHKVPYNSIYDKKLKSGKTYRSIGCWPCTKPIPKSELSERGGRALDKEELMEDLRALGYM